MHFNEIDKKILENVSRSLTDIFVQSKTISFKVFEHRKPTTETHRRYFLEHIPMEIANYLKSFDNNNRLLQIDIHDDYNVKGVPGSSRLFADKLTRKLSRTLSRNGVGIKIVRNGISGFESSKIISRNGNYIKIRTRVVRQQNSKAVNLADMSLGFFKRYKNLVNKKIKYARI